MEYGYCTRFLILLSTYFSFGQHFINQKESISTLIYKVTNEQAYQLQVENKGIDSSFLTNVIDTVFSTRSYLSNLRCFFNNNSFFF